MKQEKAMKAMKAMKEMPAEIYCALDTPDISRAEHMARQLSGHVDGLKIGLEFFYAMAQPVIKNWRRHKRRYFSI